jgi:hypothetical protein
VATTLSGRLGRDEMLMLSHASNSAAESCWQWCCRVDMAATWCRGRVMPVTVLSSHAGDGATKVTWPQHDVDAKSCW